MLIPFEAHIVLIFQINKNCWSENVRRTNSQVSQVGYLTTRSRRPSTFAVVYLTLSGHGFENLPLISFQMLGILVIPSMKDIGSNPTELCLILLSYKTLKNLALLTY